MKLAEVEQQILSHPLFSLQIPLQMQLGLPELYTERGMLMLHYRLHRQVYRDGTVLFFPAAYELKLAYPFGRVVSFTDHCFEPQDTPLCQISGEQLLTRGSALLQELYESADRVLQLWQAGDATENDLAAYQDKYRNTIRELQLQALYGG